MQQQCNSGSARTIAMQQQEGQLQESQSGTAANSGGGGGGGGCGGVIEIRNKIRNCSSQSKTTQIKVVSFQSDQ